MLPVMVFDPDARRRCALSVFETSIHSCSREISKSKWKWMFRFMLKYDKIFKKMFRMLTLETFVLAWWANYRVSVCLCVRVPYFRGIEQMLVSGCTLHGSLTLHGWHYLQIACLFLFENKFYKIWIEKWQSFRYGLKGLHVSSTVDVENTCTKASPTRCSGSQISKRLLSSSRNCWCMLKIAGTIRNISSTVWASISDACSCDFNGFKYFCSGNDRKLNKKVKSLNLWCALIHYCA